MTDLTTIELPAQLDPEPTFYGTGRIVPQVAPDGSTEYSRAIDWYNKRATRLAFGGQLRVKFVGDPVVAMNIRAAWQPLLDYIADQPLPVTDV